MLSTKPQYLKFLQLVFILCFTIITSSQDVGDFRSVASGNWTNTSVWQLYNGSSWVSATTYPGQVAGTNNVVIQGGYSVTISSNIPNAINSLIVGDGIGATDTFYVGNTTNLITPLITIANGGYAAWTSNVSLFLPSGAAFVIQTGGTLATDKPCSAAKRIVIGSVIYSTCNGGAGADYSFDDLNSQGGSLAVTPSSNGPICESETLNLSANPSGTGSSGAIFVWSGTGPGSYSFSSTIENPTIASLPAGSYTYTVTITDANGNSNTNTTDVTVTALPTITGTTPGSRTGTGTVDIAAVASLGVINWYASASGGVALYTGNIFTTPSISSTTTYYAEASNNGCISTSRTGVIATVTIPVSSSITNRRITFRANN